MGCHVWLLLATVITELVVLRKWSKNQFSEPFPTHIKWAWSFGSALLIMYPLAKVKINFIISKSCDYLIAELHFPVWYS